MRTEESGAVAVQTPSDDRSIRRWIAEAWRLVAGGPRRADNLALALVLLLALADAGFFGALATLRYLTHHADAFDLGVEDQSFWSTWHGSFLGNTLERRLATTYLGYHIEPISVVASTLYLVYDSPISLIVLKSILLALGAIPAYWLARRRLGSAYAGVIFAVAYLLFPGLEAAGLYDWHAYTLTAPFLLAACCFLETRRYGWFLVFLALAGSTKENSLLVAVPIGLYLILTRREYKLGGGIALAGLTWFAFTSYVVIPHFNNEGQSYLWNRYGDMTGSPVGAVGYFLNNPNLIWAPVPSDPNWHYLVRLTVPVAELALLSPTALFFMSPTLAINLLTPYGPMHLIETYHYSAPLIPFVILGGIFGMGTLLRLAKRLRLPRALATTALCTLVLAATLVYHRYRGYTPLSGMFTGYPLTQHDRFGNQLAAELGQTLPLASPLSAQGNQYPHLSHRPLIWRFPEIDEAEAIFLDVSTLPNTTGLNEGIHDRVRDALNGGQFGPVTAVDGYLVLRRGAPPAPLPDAFFAFARASDSAIQHPLDVQFGDLELLGYDVIPDRDGKVNLRTYWRALRPIQQDYFLPFFITDGQGHEVGAAIHREPANFWYPTNRWRTGEIVQVQTFDLPIGRQGQDFGIALGVQLDPDPWNTLTRVRPIARAAPTPLRTPGQGLLVEVAAFHNVHGLLSQIEPPIAPEVNPQHPLAIAFDEGIGLTGYSVATDPATGVALTLDWQASGATTVPYTVFVHVLDRDGKLIAQLDSPPSASVKATTAWIKGETIVDGRQIPIPKGISLAGAKLEVGLYDPATGRRLNAQVRGQVVDHVDLAL
jgi:uncharacterized membrane protein